MGIFNKFFGSKKRNAEEKGPSSEKDEKLVNENPIKDAVIINKNYNKEKLEKKTLAYSNCDEEIRSGNDTDGEIRSENENFDKSYDNKNINEVLEKRGFNDIGKDGTLEIQNKSNNNNSNNALGNLSEDKKEKELSKASKDDFSKFSRKVELEKKGIFRKIERFFSKGKIDNDKLNELKRDFIEADFGNKFSDFLLKEIEMFYREKKSGSIEDLLNKVVVDLVNNGFQEFQFNGLKVIFVCGVNGNGKTSVIGKMANKFQSDGKKVLLAACDTFRAGAAAQLDGWAKIVGCDIVIGKEKADPSSVAYQACEKALEGRFDVLMIDTAGRLQNKANLMGELKKIEKTIGKFGLDVCKILVADTTVGQNIDSQFEVFNEMIGIDGMIFTKLDGSSRNGSILRMIFNYNVKVFQVSFGEKIDDISELSEDLFDFY